MCNCDAYTLAANVEPADEKPRRRPFKFLFVMLTLGVIMLGMVLTSPIRRRRKNA